MKPLSLKKAKVIGDDLLVWYRTHKRILPFRDIHNPYFTLVSELMLQQTQVDTVIPYFERFVTAFPTVCDLAKADALTVLKLWEGLGYYRRAHHLHDAAQTICFEYGGRFPDDLALIEKLKGVGRYTARAIHSIAFDQPSPAVDGNVLRVLSRLFAYDEDITKETTKRTIENQLKPMIEQQKPSDFTQAVMELGALICQKQPKCDQCPLQDHCLAYQTASQALYPVNSAKSIKVDEPKIVFIYQFNGRYLLTQRPSKGLLADLYTFWQFDGNDLEQAKQHFFKAYRTRVSATQPWLTQTHVFSHKRWLMQVFFIETEQPLKEDLFELHDLPFAMGKAHLKLLAKLIKEK